MIQQPGNLPISDEQTASLSPINAEIFNLQQTGSMSTAVGYVLSLQFIFKIPITKVFRRKSVKYTTNGIR